MKSIHHLLTAARRNFFLDIRAEERAILDQLNRLKHHARKYGHAIGIGHPYAITAQAIGRFLKKDLGPGIDLVYVSKILPV